TFFGGGGGQAGGPIPRTQRGKDALVGVNIDLETAAFGGTVDLDVTTAVVCDTCSGAGTQEGTSIETCSLCHGAGSVQRMTRTLPARPVPASAPSSPPPASTARAPAVCASSGR